MIVQTRWPDAVAAWFDAKFSSLTMRHRAAVAIVFAPLVFIVHMTIGLVWGFSRGLGNFIHEMRESWRILRRAP